MRGDERLETKEGDDHGESNHWRRQAALDDGRSSVRDRGRSSVRDERAVVGLGGQFDGCDANWWAGNNSQTAVISGGANYLTGACQSISIARMYKTSSGQTFRVAYTTDSTPTNGNFAAYSLPIPAGTTYAGVQYVVCGSGPANCAYFQRF